MEKDERQVAEWYNNLSSSYDELYGEEQSRKYKAVLEFLQNRHFRLLVDIGCGTGTFLKQGQEIYDHAVGIDVSRKMLSIAKKRKTPKTDYVLASSSSLPIKNASSDCTVSISTAESNLPSFIGSLERISHEDSLLAVTLFHQLGAPDPPFVPKRARQSKISERETLYFLGRAETPE